MAGGFPKYPGAEDVRRAIGGGKIPPVWLWMGPEELLKEELFDELAQAVVGEGMTGLNVDRCRMGQDDPERVLLTCRTLPMLGNRRVVVLWDVDDPRVPVLEALEAYVQHAGPETVLVLAGSGDPWDAWAKRLVAAGAVVAMFWMPFEASLKGWVVDRFRKRGKRCDEATARALLEAARGAGAGITSMRDLASQVEKIVAAVGDRPAVTDDDIQAVTDLADEKLLYEAAARAVARDHVGALRAIDRALLLKNVEEIRMIAGLTHRLLSLARVRDLMDGGLTVEAAVEEAGVWSKERPAVQSVVVRWTLPQIEHALRALGQADRTLKSSGKDKRVVLEGAIALICRGDG